MNDDECYVVAKNHDLGETESYKDIAPGWNDRGNCKVKYLSDSEYGKHGFATAMDEVKPDMLYLQSLFNGCTVPCLSCAKKRGIPVLLAPRGELCAGAMKKKYKKVPYIAYLRLAGLAKSLSFQSTSEDELGGIRKYFGASARCFGLTNIPSMPAGEYVHPGKKPGEARLVFLSRIVPKKNLRQAVDALKGVKGKVCLDVYGPIEDCEYYNDCLAVARELPDSMTVSYKGTIAPGKSAAVFAGYDAFIFPTRSENYGHVIAEALSVGCPVVVSDQTPWDFGGFPEAGSALPLGSIDLWERTIQSVVDADGKEMAHKRQAAADYFRSKTQFEKLKSDYLKAFLAIMGMSK